jgi:hypothetical protein
MHIATADCPDPGNIHQKGNTTMNTNTTHADTKKVSKLRMGAAVLLGTVGVSVIGSLVPAIASADPYQPGSGPRHPVAHYVGDAEYPVWSITHPWAALRP